ncbi:MAG: energy transducer TonB [Bacteroidota bacterium]
MQYQRQEENNYPKAFAISTGIMGVLLAVSFLIIASKVEPEEIGTGGIIVNYGTSVIGMGDDYMSIEEPSTAPDANNTPPDKVTENQEVADPVSEVTDKSIVTQNSEDAPEIATKEKSTAKSPSVSAPTKESKPTVNQNALYKGKKNDGKGAGDGTGDVAGNQGSKDGDPLSPDYGEGGSGFGGVALSLANRRFTNLNIPKDDGQKYGRVAVRIFVDKNGLVVNAIPGVKGTTLSDKAIWEKCRLAVMGASLNKLESAPETQIGVVMFNFKVK